MQLKTDVNRTQTQNGKRLSLGDRLLLELSLQLANIFARITFTASKILKKYYPCYAKQSGSSRIEIENFIDLCSRRLVEIEYINTQ